MIRSFIAPRLPDPETDARLRVLLATLESSDANVADLLAAQQQRMDTDQATVNARLQSLDNKAGQLQAAADQLEPALTASEQAHQELHTELGGVADTATAAKDRADAAIGRANTATSTANTANSAAGTALAAAQGAQATATQASTAAGAAQRQADSATSTAQASASTAATAKTAADTATATANSAKTTADTALSTANAVATRKMYLRETSISLPVLAVSATRTFTPTWSPALPTAAWEYVVGGDAGILGATTVTVTTPTTTGCTVTVKANGATAAGFIHLIAYTWA